MLERYEAKYRSVQPQQQTCLLSAPRPTALGREIAIATSTRNKNKLECPGPDEDGPGSLNGGLGPIKELDLGSRINALKQRSLLQAPMIPLDLIRDLCSAYPRSHAINAKDETDKPAKSARSKSRANSYASSTTK